MNMIVLEKQFALEGRILFVLCSWTKVGKLKEWSESQGKRRRRRKGSKQPTLTKVVESAF